MLTVQKVHFELEKDMALPKERNSHSFTRDSKNKKIYLFGGAGPEGPLSDLFELDEETMAWRQLNWAEGGPSAIEMHTGHIYYTEEEKPRLIVVGGRETTFEPQVAQKFSDEIWEFDFEEKKWTVLCQLPTPIAAHAASLVQNRYLILYGGTNGAQFFDNIQRFDLQTKEMLMLSSFEGDFTCDFFKMGRLATQMENAGD